MDHEVERGKSSSVGPSSEDLSYPTAQSLTNGRLADLAARSDPEPGRPDFVGVGENGQEPTVPPSTIAITRLILRTTRQALVGSQTFVKVLRFPACARPVLTLPVCPLIGFKRPDQLQTARRLRPLRRRRDRTARPCRVFMRDRKPCFFLRRRLFG